MQAENNKNNIKTVSFGCRLNALEMEKIRNMLAPYGFCAIVVNTCSVTAEAERQSAQAVRKIARENPEITIFVTGCGATRNAELFAKIPRVVVIPNQDKMNVAAYINAMPFCCQKQDINVDFVVNDSGKMSKQFVQVQNGCNHDCAYCVTRLLRGPSVSFEYSDILADVKAAVANGFGEVVLTGIDIASYVKVYDGKPFFISDLCQRLLNDVPNLQRLRLSSVDPAVPAIHDIIKLMRENPRMMSHLHLSMQSGSDTVLRTMRRRHTADMVRGLVAESNGKVSFSWDIICGFPGETDELFSETLDLVRELRPIKIHAFPFSARPGTAAAEIPNMVDRHVSKMRVKQITAITDEICREYMQTKIGQSVSVLVESDNVGRTPDDIAVKIAGAPIPERTICNVKIESVSGDMFNAVRVM